VFCVDQHIHFDKASGTTWAGPGSANPLWGAPRIHGELLKLGIDVGQTTIAKYQVHGQA
jgi:hypothetical protein